MQAGMSHNAAPFQLPHFHYHSLTSAETSRCIGIDAGIDAGIADFGKPCQKHRCLPPDIDAYPSPLALNKSYRILKEIDIPGPG